MNAAGFPAGYIAMSTTAAAGLICIVARCRNHSGVEDCRNRWYETVAGPLTRAALVKPMKRQMLTDLEARK